MRYRLLQRHLSPGLATVANQAQLGQPRPQKGTDLLLNPPRVRAHMGVHSLIRHH
jgi:hypothetical protein